MIEIRITSTATTLTIGSWLGRERLLKIQIGSVCSPGADRERGDDDLVEGEAEGEQAAGDEGRLHARQGDAAEGRPGVAPRSAEASSKEPETRRSRATTLL